jgi:hypothetical protein
MVIPELKTAGITDRRCRVNGRGVGGINETDGGALIVCPQSRVQIKIGLRWSRRGRGWRLLPAIVTDVLVALVVLSMAGRRSDHGGLSGL